MTKMLENVVGSLPEVYPLLEPRTMLSAAELMNERRTHPDEETCDELSNYGFYTSNGIFYFVDNTTPKIVLTTERHNSILQHIGEAFIQLTQTHNYIPDSAEFQSALHAPDSLVLDLNQMRLRESDDESSYLIISTVNYNRFNPVERRLVERIYGQGNDFVENMGMLKEAKINQTEIFVLNPDYVLKHAAKNPIARASWLGDFGSDSRFSAGDRDIGDRDRVRGVRLASVSEQEASIGVAKENETSKEQVLELPTREAILPVLRPYIADPLWEKATLIVPEKAPVLGDIVQRLTDEKLLATHSRDPCINALQEMFPEYNKK